MLIIPSLLELLKVRLTSVDHLSKFIHRVRDLGVFVLFFVDAVIVFLVPVIFQVLYTLSLQSQGGNNVNGPDLFARV